MSETLKLTFEDEFQAISLRQEADTHTGDYQITALARLIAEVIRKSGYPGRTEITAMIVDDLLDGPRGPETWVPDEAREAQAALLAAAQKLLIDVGESELREERQQKGLRVHKSRT